jgi:hypothetical protein
MAECWRYVAAPASDYCKKADSVLRRVRKIISKKQDMTRCFEGMHLADSMYRFALEEESHERSIFDDGQAGEWKALRVHAYGQAFSF